MVWYSHVMRYWMVLLFRCKSKSEGNNLLSFLFTPCSRVLLEKLIGSQLVKKFPAFYGNRRFITALASARHLSLWSARSIKSEILTPTS